MRRLIAFGLGIVLVFGAGSFNTPALGAVIQYTVTDLILPDSTFGYGKAVNSFGQAVGWSNSPPANYPHAFQYNTGATIDLGTLGGTDSYSNDISDSGVIVGYSYNAASRNRGFRYESGAMVALGTLLFGNNSLAWAINPAGQIAGWADNSSANYHAVRWTNGVIQDLGTLPSGQRSFGYGINSAGQVVGSSYISNRIHQHAFLYTTSMQDLGTLGGSESFARDINDSGSVVGSAYLAGNSAYHAFRYASASMQDLGTLGGTNSGARSINNAGQIVGFAETASGVNHAFLYQNGVMLDLNDLIDPISGWVLTSADGISENGYITGFGQLNGQTHGFLLSVVPEPSTLTALGVTLVCLPGRTHPRRRART